MSLAVDVLLIVVIWWGTGFTVILRDVFDGLDEAVDHMTLWADDLIGARVEP